MPNSERDTADGDDDAAPRVASWMQLADEALSGRAKPDLTQPGRMGGATSRVLVVEDDSDVREAVAAALRDAGITCLGVPDGTAALAECQRRDPDLVILDLALPGLDGARFADAYRRIPGNDARIIVISGTDRGAETAARIRADAFVAKPFQLASLIALAERLLSQAA